jgi:hypothetical protein
MFTRGTSGYYCNFYAPRQSTDSHANIPAPSIASGSPQKPEVDFTARYKKRSRAFIDEIEEFFKLPQESFDACDPIQWWAWRQAQFPKLSRLARDITGSAVAVECIFSWGRDTISLRRASLEPDTIRTLMLV